MLNYVELAIISKAAAAENNVMLVLILNRYIHEK
jgi:hypothetical protein